MKGRVALAAVAVFLCAVTLAHATPITFTEQLIGSGALGGTSFTNALVTIQLLGDTATVNALPLPHDFGPATVSVSGLGTAMFTDPQIWAFDNPGIQVAGISDITLNLLIADTTNPAFGTYDLKSPIGPISGAVGFNGGQLFPTTLGNFGLTSVDRSTSTFSATVAAVPEPASLTLTVLGLAAIVSRGRRRAYQ